MANAVKVVLSTKKDVRQNMQMLEVVVLQGKIGRRLSSRNLKRSESLIDDGFHRLIM